MEGYSRTEWVLLEKSKRHYTLIWSDKTKWILKNINQLKTTHTKPKNMNGNIKDNNNENRKVIGIQYF